MSSDAERLEFEAAAGRLEAKQRREGIVSIRRAPPVIASAADTPHSDTDPDDFDDALSTLLPDGAEVVAAFESDDRRELFHRKVFLVRLRIVDGDHAGRALLWFMRTLQMGRPVARGSTLATSFVAATGLRPPRDLARRRPSWWLSDAQFRIRTRLVGKDVHGVKRPEAASYSVAAAILERVAGCPPALRERR